MARATHSRLNWSMVKQTRALFIKAGLSSREADEAIELLRQQLGTGDDGANHKTRLQALCHGVARRSLPQDAPQERISNRSNELYMIVLSLATGATVTELMPGIERMFGSLGSTLSGVARIAHDNADSQSAYAGACQNQPDGHPLAPRHPPGSSHRTLHISERVQHYLTALADKIKTMRQDDLLCQLQAGFLIMDKCYSSNRNTFLVDDGNFIAELDFHENGDVTVTDIHTVASYTQVPAAKK